jgi:hypothetical protein
MAKESKLLVSFPDSSQSFAYGVEYGRLLQKIQDGKEVIENEGFPVRVENIQVLKSTCEAYGYIPIFGNEHRGEWIEFMGIKQTSSDN